MSNSAPSSWTWRELPGMAVFPGGSLSFEPDPLKGVPMRDKGFYTFARAYHGLKLVHSRWTDKSPSRPLYFHKDRNRKDKCTRRQTGEERHGNALVFEPNFFGTSVHELAASIAALPFMEELFDHGFMIAKYSLSLPNNTVEMETVVAATELNVFPPKFGQLSGDLFFFWQENGLTQHVHTTFNEILSSCTSIERVVGGCEKCEEDFKECSSVRLEHWFAKQAHRDKIEKILQEPNTCDQMDEDDLVEFFEEFGSCNNWDYISPGKTSGPFTNRMRTVSEHQMDNVLGLHEERSQRAMAAVETKKALQICHEDCVFFERCCWIDGTHNKHNAVTCQGDHSYYRYHGRRKQGPFTKETLQWATNDLLRASAPSWLPRKHIALIAANSGLQTRIVGPEIQLVGLQPDMRSVKFRATRTPYEEFTYTFKDAVDICRLPFWYRGGYESPGFSEPRVELTDTELLLYYEICQQDHLKSYFYGWLKTCEPIIMDIDWSPCLRNRAPWEDAPHNFSVTGHAGWQVHVESIQDIEHIFGDFPHVLS